MNKEKFIKEIEGLDFYGHPRFYDLVLEMVKIHSSKNKDYATREDPLQNFKRVGELARRYKLVTEGYESTKIGIIYMLKQLDASLKLLRDRQVGEVENIPKRLMDVAVYSLLEIILYEEEEYGLI